MHLREHELLERSKEYEKIVAFLGVWQGDGVATCPICRKMVCTKNGYDFQFMLHVDQHTKVERAMHAAEIAQSFKPYLTGQEQTRLFDSASELLQWSLDPEFRTRCEEAGVLSQPGC